MVSRFYFGFIIVAPLRGDEALTFPYLARWRCAMQQRQQGKPCLLTKTSLVGWKPLSPGLADIPEEAMRSARTPRLPLSW
ncbi:hypothetical protein F5X68DRAFT_203689 [Plectosphaerella plurivora]|uniref:Uncharacterized protein n=1 Tax=Plectosphaerella plurivora TaxID=936078 RepID=A0A9P8VG41_9PEZI|nr:hypothetical protein F5X68DRAFT_203689 [Plectosphaerella plurivora]